MKNNVPVGYKSSQSVDSSVGGNSDGESATSGEYVLNTQDSQNEQLPTISKDVYV